MMSLGPIVLIDDFSMKCHEVFSDIIHELGFNIWSIKVPTHYNLLLTVHLVYDFSNFIPKEFIKLLIFFMIMEVYIYQYKI